MRFMRFNELSRRDTKTSKKLRGGCTSYSFKDRISQLFIINGVSAISPPIASSIASEPGWICPKAQILAKAPGRLVNPGFPAYLSLAILAPLGKVNFP